MKITFRKKNYLQHKPFSHVNQILEFLTFQIQNLIIGALKIKLDIVALHPSYIATIYSLKSCLRMVWEIFALVELI